MLARYGVEKILYTGVIHNSPGYINWLESIKSGHVPLMITDGPQTIVLGEACRLEILYPFVNLAGRGVENLNNSSIVIKLIHGQNVFLFMGDAETEVEEELLRAGVDLSADVLKAGHHGSDTSSGREFLAAVDPGMVVMEVGEGNGFGHPSPRTIKRMERLGAEILRTDLEGTIIMKSDGKKIWRR